MNGTQSVFYVDLCPAGDAQVPFYGQEGLGVAFDPGVLTELARRLQLSFLPEESLNTEMCFLHSPEVRPEFKQSFNLRDFTDFLHGVLSRRIEVNDSANLRSKTIPIPYPEDPDVFWQLVAEGAVNR